MTNEVSKPDKARLIETVLSRGVERIYPDAHAVRVRFETGERLHFYLGIDPTGPTLHMGHIPALLKLRQLQGLGHEIILLIGDFTAMIGDPTDKLAVRKKLSRDEVLENAKLYQEQASKFLAFDGENPAKLMYNSAWLSAMHFADVLELASKSTVNQMLKRDMFARRMEEGKPVYMHEFLYPLLQGYDSIAMEVDGEVGGNDQTFNMLVGRDLAKEISGREKIVVAMKLLVDTNGKKMGKTDGNAVSLLDTPEDMFGKVMSWTDGMILPVFELCTDVSDERIGEIRTGLEGGENPKDAKAELARELVASCYGREAAEQASAAFASTFSEGAIPENIPEVSATAGTLLVDALLAAGIVASKSEFRRLIAEGAVFRMEAGEKISDPFAMIGQSETLRIGKKRFVRIVV
jgi:tyrosyl-tRNA synthetase